MERRHCLGDQVAAIELVYDVAVALQVLSDNLTHGRFVIDDQDPRGAVVHMFTIRRLQGGGNGSGREFLGCFDSLDGAERDRFGRVQRLDIGT